MDKKIIKQVFISFLLNVILMFFIASTYLKYTDKSDYLLANIYFVLASLSHFILLYLPVFLVSWLIYFFTKSIKTFKIIFIILSILFLIILKLDSIVFSQFRYHLSPFVFSLVFGKGASDIFSFSLSEIITVVLKIVTLIALQFVFFKLAKKIIAKNYNLRIKLLTTLFFIALLFSHFIYAWADASYYRPITQMAQVYPLYSPLTARTLITEKLGLVDKEKVRKNRDLYKITSKNKIKYPLKKIQASKKDKPKNIIFLTIDSWRFDMMDSIVTPNIYKISKKSQLFNNHYSGSNSTLGGVFSMFYGISALYWEQFTQLEKSPVFIDQLNKQHYNINIFASANLQNPPFDKNAFTAVKNLRLDSNGKNSIEKDIDITNAMLKQLDNYKTSQPHFNFVFFDAAHDLAFPKNYKKPFKPSLKVLRYMDLGDDYNPDKLINRYKNSLHFVDSLIGKILNKIEENKLLDDTIIVITGDHGQEFNDNKKGYWQHGGNYTKYQLKVPMIIYDATKPATQYNKLSLHYDLVPTFMKNYLGVNNKLNDYTIGQDLYQLTHRDWFVAGYNNNYAIIEKDRITKVFPTGLFEITDLELNNLMNAKLHYDVLKNALNEINKFYEK